MPKWKSDPTNVFLLSPMLTVFQQELSRTNYSWWQIDKSYRYTVMKVASLLVIFNVFSFSQNPMKWISSLTILNPSNPLCWWKNGLLNDSPSHPGSRRYSFPYSDRRAGHNRSIIHFAGNGSLTETRALWYPPLCLSRLSLHAWRLCPMMLR